MSKDLKFPLMCYDIIFKSVFLKNEKNKRCDFVIRFDKDYILNLELNRQSYTGLIVRNLSYVFNLFSTHTKVGNKYTSSNDILNNHLW